MTDSIRTFHQTRTYTRTANGLDVKCTVRYDDSCRNGHNTFSITGESWQAGKPHIDRYSMGGGCIHETIAATFPELAHLIRWHLCSSDGPLHYIANTLYLAGGGKSLFPREPQLEAAREAAVWPDATLEQLRDEAALKARLPALLAEFRADVEALGFVW